jgi:hypothetical protein
MKRGYLKFILLLLLSGKGAFGQNYSGTWEGVMGDQYLQVNIVQEKDKFCGYTYDYVLTEPRNYCRAWFDGHYNKKQDAWILSGVSFIDNSGSHILMHIKLWHEKRDDNNTLQAMEMPKSALDFFMTLGATQYIELKRVSEYPTPLPGNMPFCFNEDKHPEDTVVVVKKPPVADTVATPRVIPQPPPVNIVKADTAEDILKKSSARKNIVVSRLPVDVKNITLNVYDNAIVDGDTVTILFNNRLLVSRQRLSEKPIVLDIELDTSNKANEIILFAENLGSIPPNTALVVVLAGNKRFELHASASLKENAVLIFEYAPK